MGLHLTEAIQLPAQPPSNSTEVLGSKLDAVYQIMGARGKVRQKRSRPLRAQLSVRCPKISVQLDTGNDSQSSCFEVAMHKLDMQLLAGSQHHEQLQSGAGPMSIEVISISKNRFSSHVVAEQKHSPSGN